MSAWGKIFLPLGRNAKYSKSELLTERVLNKSLRSDVTGRGEVRMEKVTFARKGGVRKLMILPRQGCVLSN